MEVGKLCTAYEFLEPERDAKRELETYKKRVRGMREGQNERGEGNVYREEKDARKGANERRGSANGSGGTSGMAVAIILFDKSRK